MSTTATTTETDAPATQPELRISIVVPLPADAFEQARVMAAFERETGDLIAAIRAAAPAATIVSRIVKPKPTKPGSRAGAGVAAALALLLLPVTACGGGTSEPDCLWHPAEHCIPTASGDDLGAGSF